jgi:hypothetical protein
MSPTQCHRAIESRWAYVIPHPSILPEDGRVISIDEYLSDDDLQDVVGRKAWHIVCKHHRYIP